MPCPLPGAHVEPQRPTRSVNTFCTQARLHSASANQQQFAAAQPSMSKPPRAGQAATSKPSHAPIMHRPYQPPSVTKQTPSVTVPPCIPCRKLPLVAWWQRLRPQHGTSPNPCPSSKSAGAVLLRSSRAPPCPGLTRQISRQCCPTGRRHYSLLVAATPETVLAHKAQLSWHTFLMLVALKTHSSNCCLSAPTCNPSQSFMNHIQGALTSACPPRPPHKTHSLRTGAHLRPVREGTSPRPASRQVQQLGAAHVHRAHAALNHFAVNPSTPARTLDPNKTVFNQRAGTAAAAARRAPMAGPAGPAGACRRCAAR